MTRDKNGRKKLNLNKLTIWNLDQQVNILENGEQKNVKGGTDGATNTIQGITKLPQYCAPNTN
jgi:hypothetical protein